MDRQDGAAVAGSALKAARRRRLVVLYCSIAFAIVAGLVATGVRFVAGATPGPSASEASGARTGAPVSPSSRPASELPTAAAESDSFDGWAISGDDSGTRFLASDDRTEGAYSLLIARPDEASPGTTTLAQVVSVAQNSTIRLSFNAMSDASAAAIQVSVGDDTPATVRLPDVPFGWQRFSVDWHAPPGVRQAALSITVSGPTSTRIDDVSIQGAGSRGVVVANPGFEENSADLELLTSTLVFTKPTIIGARTRRAPSGSLTWSMQEYTGGTPITGRSKFEDSVAPVDLRRVPAGYYTLKVKSSVQGVDTIRTTNVLIADGAATGATTPLLGIGVHLGATSDSDIAQQASDLAAVGFKAARIDADWASVEVAPGQFDFSNLDRLVGGLEKAGLKPLLVLAYRNHLYDGGRTPSSAEGIAAYARFAAAVAQRYPGSDLDLYNEYDFRFNNGSCGTSPACYLALVRSAAQAVAAEGASGVTAGPSIAGSGVQQAWLQAFIDAGGLGVVGALDFHPYVQPARPEVLHDQLSKLQVSLSAAGKADFPVWFSEFGTSTVPGWASERQQAQDVARSFGVAASHRVARLYWYDAVDDGTDRNDLEDNFGLFRATTSLAPHAAVPKPAAAVMAASARAAGGRASIGGSVSRDQMQVSGFDGALLAWSAGDDLPAVLRGADSAWTMTGRSLVPSTVDSLTADPVWLFGKSPAVSSD